MEEKETIHWAEKFAEEILKKKPNKPEYMVQSGITPSGDVHAGNFREVMTQELIYDALVEKGVKVRYQYYWDDYDRFRKVPAGVDPAWEKYIGMPVFKVPDPQGCHDNYAEHYEAPLIEENKTCGIHCDYVHSSKEYPTGIYSDQIKTAIDKTVAIKLILNKFRKENLGEDWLPVEVYCDECWKDTTKVTYKGDYNLTYSCECGHVGEFDFRKTGNVKLRWRIDWPMRWAYYDIDFESSGKDHHAAGGSWDTGTLVCTDIFGHDAPLGPMYEFVYFKGRSEKMSKSTGNVVKVRELLEVYEPELVRYLYTAKISKAFEISFDADLLNTYNYFDDARKMYYGKMEPVEGNEVKKYSFSKLGKDYVELPQFSVCANVIQITVGNIDQAKLILKKLEHPYADADNRLALAWSWVQKYAPEQFKFTVQTAMPKVEVRPEVKEILDKIADKIELPGEQLQQVIYNSAKDNNVPVKELFTVFYRLLLNKEMGPRLGPFLTSLDKEFVVKRLRMEA
jgi:lysyl-tRNA synthetase class 1